MTNFYKILRYWTVIALIATVISCASCAVNVPRDYFAYCDSPFSVTISGVIDESEVEVRLQCDFTEHDTKDIYIVMVVTYTAPEGLDGMTVTRFSDGRIGVRLMDVVADASGFEQMVAPFFLLCPDGEYSSVTVTEDGGTEITFSSEDGEVVYFFGKDGILPTSISGKWMGREVTLTVKNFEKRDK